MLAAGEHQAADRNPAHLADCFANDREGVMANLALDSARVDLDAVDEHVDLDGLGRLQRHVLEFFLGHLDESVGVVAVRVWG